MDTKELYIELAKYKYLKDMDTVYSEKYAKDVRKAFKIISELMLSDLIDDDIHG